MGVPLLQFLTLQIPHISFDTLWCIFLLEAGIQPRLSVVSESQNACAFSIVSKRIWTELGRALAPWCSCPRTCICSIFIEPNFCWSSVWNAALHSSTVFSLSNTLKKKLESRFFM